MTARLEIPSATLAKVAIAAVLTLAAMWLLRSLATVFVMVGLALLVSVVLSSFVDLLQRKGMGRGLASLVSIVAILLVGGAVLAITLPPLVHELNAFFDNLPRTADALRRRLAGNPGLYNALTNRIEQLRRDPTDILTGALQFGFGAAANVFAGALLLTLALYFQIDRERVRATVLRLTPPVYRERMAATMDGTADVIRSYFIGQSIMSSVFAIFTFVVLTILDVPYAAVFAALAFFLDAIPNIGSLLGTVMPALVALANKGITTAAIVVVVFMAYQQLENNFIQPRVLSRKLNVPPVAMLIAVLAGGKLLGIVGVILAIPLVGTLPVLERIWLTRSESRPGPTLSPIIGTGD